MPSNKQLIEKADMAIGDLASGGRLTPEQESTFFRRLIAWPTMLADARIVLMSSPKREVNKIGFGSRVMRAAVSGTALVSTDRVKPDLSQVVLDTKEIMAECWIPYDALEDNIEGQSMADTIMSLLTERAALDIDELLWRGDAPTGGGDAYLAVLDGVLKLSTSHIVNAGGAALSSSHFKDVLKSLPEQYQRSKASLRHYVAVDQETEYRDKLALRATGYGDGMLTGTSEVVAFGVPVTPAPMITATSTFTTNPKNIIVGFHREVMVEVDKDIRTRTWIIVLTVRLDVKIEDEDAVVKGTTLAAA